MALSTYKEKIKKLSEAIVEAQRPIRILNSIKPSPELTTEFVAAKYKALPKINANTYAALDLGFNVDHKLNELKALSENILFVLGKKDEVGVLLREIVREYENVVLMLKHRGTAEFYNYSRKLYGSSKDHLLSDSNTVLEMSNLLYSILGGIKNTLTVPNSEKDLSAQEAVDLLNERFRNYFGDQAIEAMVSDGIVADAAAGGDKIKLRADKLFSQRDVNIYEVHEGWVHVGTTMNGRQQPVAKWLAIGPPRCTSTQEGLAVLMEIFTFRTSVTRAQIINDRIIAVAKAEEGANLLEVFEYFRTEGYEEEDCLKNSFRVFRGAPLTGGAPFTKDISYCKGFVENYNFIRTAIRANKPYLIPFLFVGKVNVQDIPLTYKLYREGIIAPPQYLPEHFADINGIAVWMSFSSFFNKVDLKRVQDHYNKLFRKYA